MQKSLKIFESSLAAAGADEAGELIELLGLNLAQTALRGGAEHRSGGRAGQKTELEELLRELVLVLKKLDLASPDNTTCLIRALIRAGMSQAEAGLLGLMNEAELLAKKIEEQRALIKDQTGALFEGFEGVLAGLGLAGAADDAVLFEIELLGILRETAESAFLTTLERGEDVGLTSHEIAKSLVYNASCEAKFQKDHILQIAKTVLQTGFELANQSLAYASELCAGLIRGTQEGLELALEKFKSSLLAADEGLAIQARELIRIEDDFINLLKNEAASQESPAKELIAELLANELDSLLARLARLANEGREQLAWRLGELKIKNLPLKILPRNEGVAYEKREFVAARAKQLGIRLWEQAKKLLEK